MAEETVRLTKDLRRQIANRLIANAQAKTKAGDAASMTDIIKRSKALAEQAYGMLYDEATRKRMAKLPAGWLPTDTAVNVSITGGGKHYKLHFNGLSNFLPRIGADTTKADVSIKRRVFTYKDKNTYEQLNVARDSALIKELSAIEVEANKITERDKKLKAETDSVLASVTTLKQLIATWPEVESVARAVVAGVTVIHHQVPARILTDLNVKLGLAKAA